MQSCNTFLSQRPRPHRGTLNKTQAETTCPSDVRGCNTPMPFNEHGDLGMLLLTGACALLCLVAVVVALQGLVQSLILARIAAIERKVMQVKVTERRSQSAGLDGGDGQRGVQLLRARSDGEACRRIPSSDAQEPSSRRPSGTALTLSWSQREHSKSQKKKAAVSSGSAFDAWQVLTRCLPSARYARCPCRLRVSEVLTWIPGRLEVARRQQELQVFRTSSA